MTLTGGRFCGQVRYEISAALAFCKTCGTTLCGMQQGEVHGVTLGSVDGDPGVEIEMHIFVGSKARSDHIGGNAPQHLESAPTA